MVHFRYGIQFGDRSFSGTVSIPIDQKDSFKTLLYDSGTSIVAFPPTGIVLSVPLVDDNIRELNGAQITVDAVPVVGLYQTEEWGGRIAVMGDSNCLDSSLFKDTVRIYMG